MVLRPGGRGRVGRRRTSTQLRATHTGWPLTFPPVILSTPERAPVTGDQVGPGDAGRVRRRASATAEGSCRQPATHDQSPTAAVSTTHGPPADRHHHARFTGRLRGFGGYAYQGGCCA